MYFGGRAVRVRDRVKRTPDAPESLLLLCHGAYDGQRLFLDTMYMEGFHLVGCTTLDVRQAVGEWLLRTVCCCRRAPTQPPPPILPIAFDEGCEARVGLQDVWAAVVLGGVAAGGGDGGRLHP